VFTPTEIKKNGPARMPAITPARRSAARFTAASAVLPATAQSYGDARDSVNARWWQWFTARSRASEHSPREWPGPDVEPRSQGWPLASLEEGLSSHAQSRRRARHGSEQRFTGTRAGALAVT
jgi:hypothetical protein